MAESVIGSAGSYRQLVINRFPRIASALRGIPAESSAEEVLAVVEAEVRSIMEMDVPKKKSKKAE